MSLDTDFTYVGLVSVSVVVFSLLHPIRSLTEGLTNSICVYSTHCAENSYWCYPNLNGAQPVCHCHPGFNRSTYISHGAWNCVDIDECSDGQRRCLGTSRCVNTLGGYRCQCGTGQVYAGNNCVDFDECQAGVHRCGFGTHCVNTDGAYRCECQDPSKPVLRSAKTGTFFCEIQCRHEEDACSYNKLCVGNGTTFACRCRHGFVLSVEGICEYIQVCDRRDPCEENSVYCTYNGRSHCICKEGYERDRAVGNNAIACRDVDECLDSSVCRDTSICENTAGGFRCVCPEGYQYVDQRCRKCEKRGRCGQNAVYCHFGAESTCICEKGFIFNNSHGTGIDCKDVNECSVSPGPCGSGTDCVNTRGSYTCVCRKGFSHQTGDPNTCQDIDECQQSDLLCGVHAQCRNTNGSFECECVDGYTGDGYTCNDVDECREPGTCGPAEECVNLIGDYECRPEESGPKRKEPDLTGVHLDETRSAGRSAHSTTWPFLYPVASLVYSLLSSTTDRRYFIVSSH